MTRTPDEASRRRHPSYSAAGTPTPSPRGVGGGPLVRALVGFASFVTGVLVVCAHYNPVLAAGLAMWVIASVGLLAWWIAALEVACWRERRIYRRQLLDAAAYWRQVRPAGPEDQPVVMALIAAHAKAMAARRDPGTGR